MGVVNKDIFSKIFMMLFAIYISIESYRLGLGKWSMPGPGYFPFIAGVVLGTISLSLLVQTLLKASLKSLKLTEPTERLNWQNIILTLSGMLTYVFLINWVGFVLCTFLLMVFLIWAVGRRHWSIALIAAGSITLASYLLFEVLLDAQLPRGFLGF